MRRIQEIVTDVPFDRRGASRKGQDMFSIKICGVRTLDDALMCAEAGADAIGLNFCASSPRYVSPAHAEAICAGLPPAVARVGVFVNAPIESMRELTRRLPLDWIQLHGDEPAEILTQLAPCSVIRVFRSRGQGFSPLLEDLALCRANGTLPAALLVDAWQADAYGGTGKTVDWDSVSQLGPALAPLPVVLAGGLNRDNVQVAIRAARPRAVDTASGVESQPGAKDPRLVADFVRRARRAFEELAAGG